MSQSTQIFLEKEGVRKQVPNPNTDEEQNLVLEITKKVNAMFQLQTQSWREFNDRTLRQYIDDNEKRINNYVTPREEDLDDWQTKGFEGITREKMFAFVSAVATKRPQYKFKATKKDGFIDKTIAEVIEDFHEYSWIKEDPTSVAFFLDAWDIAGHGTGIKYEGVCYDEYLEEEFDEYDVKTGKVKGLRNKKLTSDINCQSRRVRLTDFLIADWYEPNFQNQPYLAEILIMDRSKFDEKYGEYYNAEKVPEMKHVRNDYGETFFMNQWNELDHEEDKVHVTFFYEKGKKRRFSIIANGVLISHTPFPRKDGMYPYGRGIFKPFADSSFVYAKALPDEIAWDQDIYNAFKNMVVDRSILHINRPMITDAQNEFTDVFMSPSKILNLKGNVTQLDIAPPGAADFQMLGELRGAINRQSSDSQQSGQTGKGVTAREIVVADENARKLAGVFRLFLEAFDLELTRLRVGNIMQFYFEPLKVSEILDDETKEDFKMVYRAISLSGKKLSDGMHGIKNIEVVGSSDDLPQKEDIVVDEMVAKEQGYDLERVVVSADYIKNVNLDVQTIPESTYQSSRSLTLAMENEYQQLISTLYPMKFQEYNSVFFKQLNEVYDKDMTEFEEPTDEVQQIAPEGQEQPSMPMTAELGAGQPTLGKMVGLTA